MPFRGMKNSTRYLRELLGMMASDHQPAAMQRTANKELTTVTRLEREEDVVELSARCTDRDTAE